MDTPFVKPVVWLFNLIGGAGLVLCFVGLFPDLVSGHFFVLLLGHMDTLAASLTLGGTLIAISSAYLKLRPEHPPRWWTFTLTIPAVLILCGFSAVSLWRYGSIPELTLNGLGMLGLAGAVFRM